MPGKNVRTFAFVADDDETGKRLDALISSSFPEISRSFSAQLIREGLIRVNDSAKKPSYRVNATDLIAGQIPVEEVFYFTPEPIDIDILFENADCLVINKQPGIVVHPSPGHEKGTLANGLIFHRPKILGIGGVSTRPGIVHRLDKDTSGVMVIAKTEQAFHQLSLQFKERTIHKSYIGFVYGIMPEKGHISLPIGRHVSDRKKMSTTDVCNPRPAETYWDLIQQFVGIALVKFTIKTGRTHQIRVHAKAIGHAIVGDPVYGIKNPKKSFQGNPKLAELVKKVPRQLLHARELSFTLPGTEKMIRIEAPIPDDMRIFQDELTLLS